MVGASFDLSAQLDRLPDEQVFPFHLGDVRLRSDAPCREKLRLLIHRHDEVLIAEFEPVRLPAALTDHDHYYPLVREFVGSVHTAGDLQALLQQTVQQLKRITGFGRVMAYRFDAQAMARYWPRWPMTATRATWACAFRLPTSRARPANCIGSTASA